MGRGIQRSRSGRYHKSTRVWDRQHAALPSADDKDDKEYGDRSVVPLLTRPSPTSASVLQPRIANLDLQNSTLRPFPTNLFSLSYIYDNAPTNKDTTCSVDRV